MLMLALYSNVSSRFTIGASLFPQHKKNRMKLAWMLKSDSHLPKTFVLFASMKAL